jgi:AcrR family transcriptional regulator
MGADSGGELDRQRAPRRDARANRERILEVAAEMISREGPGVPLAAIADAAGVGIGTFYRGFPDRTALMAALQHRAYDILLAILDSIEASEQPGIAAIETYLVECLAVADQLILPLRGATPVLDQPAVAGRERIMAALERILLNGWNDGTVRGDVTPLDVIVCGSMISQPLSPGLNWSLTARRHIAVFVRGISTAPSGSAPTPAASEPASLESLFTSDGPSVKRTTSSD